MPELLLYHYYFKGIPEPLVIQATNRADARKCVPEAIKTSEKHKGLTIEDIINETVAEPVSGVTKCIIDGRHYVWGGQGNGWKPLDTTNEKEKT